MLTINLCNRIHYKTICTSRRFDKSFDVKPYLRPMSSMTVEEKKEFDELTLIHTPWGIQILAAPEKINKIYKKMLYKYFPYRYFPSEFSSYEDFVKHLKEKGFAIEVTEENNLYKE